MRAIKILSAIGLVVALTSPAGLAHEEREASFPDGSGKVPKYRSFPAEPYVVVCSSDSRAQIRSKIQDPALRARNLRLLRECRFNIIQQAIDSLTKPGSTIYLLPGVYEEKPNRGAPKCAEGFEGRNVLSYEEQLSCPHAQNLVAIFGDGNPTDDKRVCNLPTCDLQLEGTGDDPKDVIITGGFKKDGDWAKLNGIRADRADGAYFKNFTIQLFEFNALYVLETDGFVIDDVLGRWNDEYAYLTFAVDHGLYKNCEAYGNGDSGVYPGSASDVNADSSETGRLKRWAIEIRNCRSHHNALGYSGTAGNSVYAHNNRFYKNGTGIATDSVFPDHPGLPQDHAWFRDNLIYSNNVNYYEKYVHSGICDKPPAERGYEKGTVCPVIPAPVGTGILIAGGNYNYIEGNDIFDNWRTGVMQFGVPAAIREEPDPTKQFDTSNYNHYVGNFFGLAPGGGVDLNGIDVWWDDQGSGNCWQENKSGYEEIAHNSLFGSLPDCDSGGSPGLPMGPRQVPLAPCATYDRDDPEFRDPPVCDWFDTPEEPEEEGQGRFAF